MSKTRTETCGCGQVTHLVTKDGVEIYDATIHGSFAPAGGKCFNCHKPFGSEAPAPEPAGPVEPAKLSDMKVKDLKALAKDEDISLAGLKAKADIIAEIEAVRAERAAAEPGDEDPADDPGDDD